MIHITYIYTNTIYLFYVYKCVNTKSTSTSLLFSLRYFHLVCIFLISLQTSTYHIAHIPRKLEQFINIHVPTHIIPTSIHIAHAHSLSVISVRLVQTHLQQSPNIVFLVSFSYALHHIV